MTVVFDTVVLVRGLLDPQSWWGRLLFDYAERYELVVSPAIVAEYLDVLTRPRLARKFRVIATRDFAAVLRIVGNATVVLPSHTPAVCRDPEDDKFIAAAMLGGAAFIVSEDADLLDLQSYEGIAIVPAEQLLRMLDGSARSSP